MYVTIQSIERLTRTNAKGTGVVEGIEVIAIKDVGEYADNTEWKRWLPDYFNPDTNPKFEEFGPGDQVDIKMIKDPANAKFWKVADVISLTEAQKAPKDVDAPPPIGAPSPKAGVPTLVDAPVQVSADAVRVDVLDKAIRFVSMMVANTTVDKGIAFFKKAATPALLEEVLLTTAEKMLNFVNGDASVSVEDSVKPDLSVERDPGDAIDDDIPF